MLTFTWRSLGRVGFAYVRHSTRWYIDEQVYGEKKLHRSFYNVLCRRKVKVIQREVPWVDPQVSQEDFYERAAREAVAEFLDSAKYDCALLAYGATGSGKTFSAQGPPKVYLKPALDRRDNSVEGDSGYLQRALQQVLNVRFALNLIIQLNPVATGDGFCPRKDHRLNIPSVSCLLDISSSLQFATPKHYVVCICALEIYNETLRDLLTKEHRECEIIQHEDKATGRDLQIIRHREGLKRSVTETMITSVEEGMHCINDALLSRSKRPTRCADQSQSVVDDRSAASAFSIKSGVHTLC
jgi:hypothetical protein